MAWTRWTEKVVLTFLTCADCSWGGQFEDTDLVCCGCPDNPCQHSYKKANTRRCINYKAPVPSSTHICANCCFYDPPRRTGQKHREGFCDHNGITQYGNNRTPGDMACIHFKGLDHFKPFFICLKLINKLHVFPLTFM